MKIVQAFKDRDKKWEYLADKIALNNPLVLVFSNRILLEDESLVKEIREEFPYEHIIFGSTSGQIFNTQVTDTATVVTAIEFEKSSFIIKSGNILDFKKDSKALGEHLIKDMPTQNLKHLFVLSEGSFVNGSSLIQGLKTDGNAILTGGLCGDDSRFVKTVASYKENPKEGEVVLIGFYGETLEITHSSFGGWSPFGPERVITKSEGNILYEIDGKPALDLYKKYLGEKANALPEASLLYPLNVIEEGKKEAVVRTILNIDNENQSMILAGDVPQHSKVQLMMASIDGIAQGAQKAAEQAMTNRVNKPEIAILISCVGRKLVMNQRVEEEIEQVQDVVGSSTCLTGFYSYGEIAPFFGSNECELHNQTMTLTLISE